MDVRCEKCGTEYELDEARIKPNGVTVKCTTCGHLFKVGRRAITVVGVGSPVRNASPSGQQRVPGGPVGGTRSEPIRARTETGPMAGAVAVGQTAGNGAPEAVPETGSGPILESSPIPRSQPGTGSGATRERKWMIELPSGEIVTCRELATLQQWIVSGKVLRTSGISRTGRSWKRLGDIAQLRSFFEIADEARQARRERSVAQAMPEPEPARAAEPAAAPAVDARVSDGVVAAAGQGVAASRGPARQSPASAAVAEPGVVAPTREPAAGESGRWAGKPVRAESSGLSGPTGGLAHGGIGQDVAFARGKIVPIKDDFGGPDDDLDDLTPPRSGVGRWIVLVSLLLMMGAAAVVYLLVFRGSHPVGTGGQADAAVDAQAAPDAPVDAALPPDAQVAPGKDELLATAKAHILAMEVTALEALDADLAGLAGDGTGGSDGNGNGDGDKEDIEVLVTRARIHLALAQDAMDQARAADDKTRAKELERQGRERVLEALTLVTRARKLDSDHAGANTAMADVLRLQGNRAREVERYLKKALGRDRKNRDARLVQALLYQREKRARKAREALEELATEAPMETSGDVRPAIRLAHMDMDDETYADARRRVDSVLAFKPEHDQAKALLARIRAATEVDTSDPLPPEEGAGHDSSGSGDGDDEKTYDALLERAHRKAENGDCRDAMALYERAVDINPIGVAALTGMGYCHIDAKEFASAHAKFKAALVAAPRYQDALWGIAEAYQQQGLKEKAVDAYQRFIDEHPQSSRAAMARRQIERLGGAPAPDNGDRPNDNGTPDPGSSGGDTGSGNDSQGAGDSQGDKSPGDSSGPASPAGDEGAAGSSGDPAPAPSQPGGESENP